MEQKQKKKSKYTLIDSIVLIGLILLIYLVCLLVFGGIERITRIGRGSGEDVTLSLTFRVEDMDLEIYGIEPALEEDACPFLHVGDRLYIDGTDVGEIVGIDYENCMIPTNQKNEYDGTLLYATDIFRMNILITVKADGKESAQGYTIGNRTLHVGDSMIFATKEFEHEAKIGTVEIYEEEPNAILADGQSAG